MCLKNRPFFRLFKLKTKRERTAERLISLSKKWEAERLIYEEREREREAQLKIREMELLAADQKFIESRESRGANVLAIKNKSYTKNEMDLENFLKKENDLMIDRLKPKDTAFDPFTKGA